MTSTKKQKRIVSEILQLIDSGAYPAGSRLPGERTLSRRFGVSRAIIRAAIMTLRTQGWLVVRLGAGTYVTQKKEFLDRDLPNVAPLELAEARALFAAETSALSALIIENEAINELESYVDIMSGEVKSWMTAEEAVSAFHNTIARSTKNHAIIHFTKSMWNIAAADISKPDEYKNIYSNITQQHCSEYRNILMALKNRDPVMARKAMREHFMRVIEELLFASEKEIFKEVRLLTLASRSSLV